MDIRSNVLNVLYIDEDYIKRLTNNIMLNTVVDEYTKRLRQTTLHVSRGLNKKDALW